MPVASELYQEGLIIPPLKLREGGATNEALLALILRNVRTPDERHGDFEAQLGALRTGAARLEALAARHGAAELARWMDALLDYAERLTRAAIAAIPDGDYEAADAMEGADGEFLPLRARVTVAGDAATIDFAGSAPEQAASINAVEAVTRSAAIYCVRCLLPPDAPSNAGVFRPVRVIAPEGSIMNARPQRAVSAGNVETSQRVVDVVLAALARALPERMPAASAGTMSNLAFGGTRPDGAPFAYYETIPGGAGAGPGGDGGSGLQTHMTNTANTPAEALERAFPVRVRRFELRDGSGGAGRQRGGDGVVRELEFLAAADVSLIGDRRLTGPPGARGGEAAMPGANALIRADGQRAPLPGQAQLRVAPGERVEIRTPGGGGWGEPAP